MFGLVLEWRVPAHFFAIASRAVRVRPIDMECRMRYVAVEDLESPPINLQPAIDIDRLLDERAALHPGLVHGS